MVECLIAILLTAIAIVTLLPMQDTALKVMSRSDHLGRAAGIIQSELERQSNIIMNSTAAVTVSPPTIVKTVYASSDGSTSGITGAGDASFTVETKISVNAAGTNSWIVNVRVTWTGNTTGIASSMIASRI